ncbi:hypothetical protein [Cohnella faecalis]|uniref:hypothetical protein n=1 Tax=Cohnella faecalis TaxID=2315694 RepID=UPI0011C22C8F|nr:hypothetical protein [Cohnella faecalis]
MIEQPAKASSIARRPPRTDPELGGSPAEVERSAGARQPAIRRKKAERQAVTPPESLQTRVRCAVRARLPASADRVDRRVRDLLGLDSFGYSGRRGSSPMDGSRRYARYGL